MQDSSAAETLEAFYDTLMRFLALCKHQILTIAADYGLTNAQTLILILMHEDTPRPMNSFCSILSCDASNVTGLVDGLERKGMLARAENPHDRRSKIISLQPRGVEIRQAIMRRLAANNRQFILSRLTKEELAQFISLIQKLTQHPDRTEESAAVCATAPASRPAETSG